MAKKVFEKTISNLLDIGEVFEYLHENFLKKRLVVRLTLNNLIQPTIQINGHSDVYRAYSYLLQNWNDGKLRVVVESG